MGACIGKGFRGDRFAGGRPRRTYLHLSYSCAPPFGPAVKFARGGDLDAGCGQPIKAKGILARGVASLRRGGDRRGFANSGAHVVRPAVEVPAIDQQQCHPEQVRGIAKIEIPGLEGRLGEPMTSDVKLGVRTKAR